MVRLIQALVSLIAAIRGCSSGEQNGAGVTEVLQILYQNFFTFEYGMRCKISELKSLPFGEILAVVFQPAGD
ncbi:unnamed protein product [Larinioides sclopetarius]|uniref:Secreted protein n=1 Tax=Larinioides sclopetarius TaxID=280406 RepID=A0AAV1Z1U5_9ARAC